MAIFDFFKNKNKKSSERAKSRREQSFDKKEKPFEPKAETSSGLAEKNENSQKAFHIIYSPHVTEKSSRLSESGAYTFRISDKSNKTQIAEAIEELYGVNVIKVNIISARTKKRFSRGKVGERSGYKKAVVVLAKGEKIELI